MKISLIIFFNTIVFVLSLPYVSIFGIEQEPVAMVDHARILIIGDSVVAGTGASGSIGWAQLFQQNFPNLDVTIIGTGGYTIKNIVDQLAAEVSGEYDYVLLGTGLNDSRYRPSKDKNALTLEEFEVNLTQFANHFVLQGSIVYFVGITQVDESKTAPYKEDKFHYNADIIEYDLFMAQIAQKLGVNYIAVPPLNEDLSLLNMDGLHPSSSGHALLYSTIVAQLPFRSN